MSADPATSTDSLLTAVHACLHQWRIGGQDSGALDHLRLVRETLAAGAARSGAAAAQYVLSQAIERLKQEHPQSGRILHHRFVEGEVMRVVAGRVNLSSAAAYRHQKQAIARLAAIVSQAEAEAHARFQARALGRLEAPSYDRLFGVDALLDDMRSAVERDAPPWLILVQGIGGIGKTSLVDALLRRIIPDTAFDEIGWVSARQQMFHLSGRVQVVAEAVADADALTVKLAEQLLPAHSLPAPLLPPQALALLQRRLRRSPHLIVIDNLESLSDLQALLPMLRRLTAPTRFVLTSRQDLEAEPGVYRLHVPELVQADALALVRYEAHCRNLPFLAAADDEELAPIYETAGGNPLALRMIVGQAHAHALSTVLDDLRQARGQSVEALYRFIYWRAWDHLDDAGRRALLLMPLAPPRGATFEQLAAASDLDAAALHDALARLVQLNLLDRRGGLHEARFTIHSLTRSFLMEQVLRWQ